MKLVRVSLAVMVAGIVLFVLSGCSGDKLDASQSCGTLSRDLQQRSGEFYGGTVASINPQDPQYGQTSEDSKYLQCYYDVQFQNGDSGAMKFEILSGNMATLECSASASFKPFSTRSDVKQEAVANVSGNVGSPLESGCGGVTAGDHTWVADSKMSWNATSGEYPQGYSMEESDTLVRWLSAIDFAGTV